MGTRMVGQTWRTSGSTKAWTTRTDVSTLPSECLSQGLFNVMTQLSDGRVAETPVSQLDSQSAGQPAANALVSALGIILIFKCT